MEDRPAMHFLALLVTILAGAGFWFWRARQAADVVSEVGDAAGRLRGKVKRTMFRRKVEGSTLTGIEDPATAAAVLLVSIVEADRRLTPDDEARITTWLREVAEEDKPEEAVVFARWAVREVVDVNEVIRRLAPLFNARLAEPERRDFVEMAASLCGPPAQCPAQAEAMRRLRAALLPQDRAVPRPER
jgi:hypothetical protein